MLSNVENRPEPARCPPYKARCVQPEGEVTYTIPSDSGMTETENMLENGNDEVAQGMKQCIKVKEMWPNEV